MKKWKAFINEVCDVTEKTHKILEDSGCEVILGRDMYKYANQPYSENELAELAREVDALMGASRDPYSKLVMENAKNLKVIAKYGIGVENIDLPTAKELGITVTNTPVPENYSAVAEHVVGLMLCLTKKIKFLDAHLKGGGWRSTDTYTPLLVGKTVGIIGLGRIGSRICELLRSWKIKLIGYDPYISQEKAEELRIKLIDFITLLQTSDVVIVQAALTEETRKMIGLEQLRMMKSTSYMINTSRGGLIDEDALYIALTKGWIAGAALDVFDPEPPTKDNPLLTLDNTILTPHNAGWSDEINYAICLAATENCISVLKGEKPAYKVT